jgi:hypothetical protein
MELRDGAGRGLEGERVLRIDPAFDGVAGDHHVFLLELDRAAGRNADLFAHDVDAGDRFGHRMLDLQARVHLDEIEAAILEEELDRAGAQIAEFGERVGDDLADGVALRFVERGRGCFFPHFLMAALQRAIALAQMNDLAERIRQHLHFDVPRPLEIFFHVDGIVAEGALGFGARGGEREAQILRLLRDLHAASAAAGRRLDQNGKADFGCDDLRIAIGDPRAVGTGHGRNAEFLSPPAWRRSCRPSCGYVRARADEGDAVLGDDLGEARILRKKPVAGMDRFGARDLAGRDDLGNVEIALRRGGGPMHTLSSASRTCIASASAVE